MVSRDVRAAIALGLAAGCGGGGTTAVDASVDAGGPTLTVALAGDGTGTVRSDPAGIACGDDCAMTVASGTVVYLATTPAIGSAFAGWDGEVCAGTSVCELTVTEDVRVEATFATHFPLSVAKHGGGAGVVTSTPAGIDCGATCTASFDVNAQVALAQTPDPGSAFAGWSGAAGWADQACTVAMTAARAVSARYLPDTCDVFTIDDTTTVAGWTEHGADRAVAAHGIQHTSLAGTITRDASSQTDGCARAQLAFGAGAPGDQTAGLVLRWTGDTAYTVGEVGAATGSSQFDQVRLFDFPSGTLITSMSGLALGTAPVVEVCATGDQLRVRVDIEADDTYDVTVAGTTTVAGAGVAGVRTASLDDPTRAEDFCWGASF